MNYEKKYNEALERAKKLKETCDSTAVIGWCEYIFPELKEGNEDERLRKTIIAFLKEYADKGYENAVECIDWLERQGEKPQDMLANNDNKKELFKLDESNQSNA